MSNTPGQQLTSQGRLMSLDAFRGLTMFFLVAEGAGVYHALQDPSQTRMNCGSSVTSLHARETGGVSKW